MQNETTANYRHTGSLYYYYFTDKAFHTHTRTNKKNPGEKETKEKELPWLCWFAGVVRLPSKGLRAGKVCEDVAVMQVKGHVWSIRGRW